jgi:hypothetical protein
LSDTIPVSVFEVVGSRLCVASDDGGRVFEQIAAAFRQGRRVRLSFLNVETLTSAFLNAAIGQLYGPEFGEDYVRGNLEITDMAPEDVDLLRRVVDTAKLYFKDPARFEAIVRDATGGSNDDEHHS